MYDLFLSLIGTVPNTYGGLIIYFGVVLIFCFTITSLLQLIASLFSR